MKCTALGIPEYLYTEARKTYSPKHFRFYHLLYRTDSKDRENPLEFPRIVTAYSVCWSKLIIPKDVLPTIRALATNPENKGDNTYFGKVRKIRRIKIEKTYNDSEDFSGLHTLTAETIHSHHEFNYSHSEILIKHTYYTKGKKKVEVISNKDWEDKKCLLRKKAHKDFFQPMINDYKAKISTALNSDIAELDAKWYTRFLPKNIMVSFTIWKMITFNNPKKY